MYNLGLFLGQRYSGFLKYKYDSNEVFVLSSDKSRTRISARCTLAGIYRESFRRGECMPEESITVIPEDEDYVRLKPNLFLSASY